MQVIGDPRYLQMYAAAVKYMPIPNRDKNNIIRILQGSQPIDPAIVEQLQAQVQQLQSRDVELMREKISADIEKVRADTNNKFVDTRKKDLETYEVLEDIEKKSIENDLLENTRVSNINVNI